MVKDTARSPTSIFAWLPWRSKSFIIGGLHVLGGTLVSYAAVPYLYEHLDAFFGAGAKTGFGNPDIQPVAMESQANEEMARVVEKTADELDNWLSSRQRRTP